jgi:hypothetical protein
LGIFGFSVIILLFNRDSYHSRQRLVYYSLLIDRFNVCHLSLWYFWLNPEVDDYLSLLSWSIYRLPYLIII